MKSERALRRLPALICILLCLFCLDQTAFAYPAIDVGAETALTVQYESEDAALADVLFRVYRVADVSSSGDFTLTGDFAPYRVSLADQSSEGWRLLARTLSGYVQRDALESAAQGRTGQDGTLRFEGLSTGLYLVVGEPSRQDGVIYNPAPTLVSLPGADEQAGGDQYEVTVRPKYDSEPENEGTVARQVIKLWDDAENDKNRPDEIAVELLRDGEVYDCVTLSADNNWRYTWSNLEPGHQWELVEQEVPEGYTVTCDQEGETFLLTNTAGKPDAPAAPATPTSPTLPQTGQLWWPVPLLAAFGLLLFLMGWARSRKWQDEQEG